MVVAIVALLTVIALPNYLQAQVRAKVSRAVSDMRAIATALESYRTDNKAYPPNDGVFNVVPVQLTTPVAYLTTNLLIDPFSIRELDSTHGELARYYAYFKIVTESEFIEDADNGFFPPVEAVDLAPWNVGAHKKYGKWRLVSVGPDRFYATTGLLESDPVLGGSDIPYDPTNGTVSWGNILCTRKIAAVKFTK